MVAVPNKAETLHPHDLRHAFVTLSLDTGASLRDLQDATGHVDPRTTRRYDRGVSQSGPTHDLRARWTPRPVRFGYTSEG